MKMKLILRSEGVTVEYDEGGKAKSETLREGVGVVGAARGGPGAFESLGLHRYHGFGPVRRDPDASIVGAGQKRQI